LFKNIELKNQLGLGAASDVIAD